MLGITIVGRAVVRRSRLGLAGAVVATGRYREQTPHPSGARHDTDHQQPQGCETEQFETQRQHGASHVAGAAPEAITHLVGTPV